MGEDSSDVKDGLRENAIRFRWPDGFRCPKCDSRTGWLDARGWWKCTKCRHLTSITSGTVLHGTHLPLDTWIQAIDVVAREPRKINVVKGVSAWKLKSELGLGSYQTAWRMLRRIRRLMATAVEEDVLKRHVEIGLIGLRGPSTNRLHLTQLNGWVALAVEDRPGYWLGHIRMRWAARKSLLLSRFVSGVVQDGTQLSSDGSIPESALNIKGYSRHESPWANDERMRLKRYPVLAHRSRDAVYIGDPPSKPDWPNCPTQRACRIFTSWRQRRHRGGAPLTVDLVGELAEFCFYFNRQRWDRDKLFADLAQTMLAPTPANSPRFGRAK